jgi:alpha-beta hydrolase superfamily lysophospholipase
MHDRPAPVPTRGGQSWILDQLVRMSGSEDVLHPGIMGMRLERGFIYGDMQRVFERVHGVRAYPRAWEAEARRQEGLAIAAEAVGYAETAAQHRHRAALYFGRAQHLTPGGDARKKERYAALRRNYDALIGHLGGAVSHHALEFAPGQDTYALVVRAPGPGPKPTVLYIPGMDATKEDYPNPFLNDFLRRGMNVIAMDGPGQGEALAHGVKVTVDNYAAAASRVIDFAVSLPDVDAERIACFGTSMGTYWSVLAAARDRRIRALVGQMPNVGTKRIIFNEAQPNFRRIYMYMMGITDDAQFDAQIPLMDAALLEAGRQLSAPYLLVGGDLDELTPVDHIHEWMDWLRCPRELWLYQDCFHPMGEVVGDAYPAIADWVRSALDGQVPAGHDRRVEIDPRSTVPGVVADTLTTAGR